MKVNVTDKAILIENGNQYRKLRMQCDKSNGAFILTPKSLQKEPFPCYYRCVDTGSGYILIPINVSIVQKEALFVLSIKQFINLLEEI